MFDLDLAIAEWRQRMLTEGVRSTEFLDELESHLRDAVEHQARSESTLQTAFETATLQIGRVGILKHEFDKVGGTKREAPEWIKRALLSLAGIPNQYLHDSVNPSHPNIEPRWTTYFRVATFLIPAAWLWMASGTYIVPKLKQIIETAGVMDAGGFWQLFRFNIGIMSLCREHAVFIVPVAILSLMLIEWRSRQWPRYRRALFGVGAFLLNSMVLISLFTMFLAATWAGSELLNRAK